MNPSSPHILPLFAHLPLPHSVLIVEDEFLIRWALRARLSSVGFLVAEAVDLATAREAFLSPIDLVLLDLRLPDGNGIELLAEFRTARPTTRVIVMTAHGTDMTEAEVTSAGAYALVHKPFDLDHVVRLTQRAAVS